MPTFRPLWAPRNTLAPITFVDFPGHPRLSFGLSEELKNVDAIIFLADASDKPAVKESAELLYSVLTHESVVRRQPSLLLFANKSDLPGCRSSELVLQDIDREIERLRVSRCVSLGGSEGGGFLGVERKPFRLTEDASCPVNVASGSVITTEIEPIIRFIDDKFASRL
eukprot:Polyplicarium_translucidae@DN3854_c0_g1_i1.p1